MEILKALAVFDELISSGEVDSIEIKYRRTRETDTGLRLPAVKVLISKFSKHGIRENFGGPGDVNLAHEGYYRTFPEALESSTDLFVKTGGRILQ